MSIWFSVLGSGSKGNSVCVGGGGATLLVDCGFSLRATAARLAELGVEVGAIDAVVSTHLHGDHLGGVPRLLRAQERVRAYGTRVTLEALGEDVPEAQLVEVPREGRFEIGGLRVTTVPTLHDAPGSFAVRVDAGGASLGIVTDLGVATEPLVRAFSGLDGLVLEMNHDEALLEAGPYPRALVRRIRSERGHLSNAEGAALLARLHHPGLRHVTLAHLSETNNRPELALAAARSVLPSTAPVEIVVAEQRRRGPRVRLEARSGAQLGLPLHADVVEHEA